MMNIEYFNLSLGNVVLRYYLLMAIVIAAGFTGVWLLGLLALPVFLSTLMGVSIKWEKAEERTAYVKRMNTNKKEVAA